MTESNLLPPIDGSSDEIRSVDLWECDFALAAPLALGSSSIRSREYTFARLTTTSGRKGGAFVLSRGAPLAIVAAQLLAPPLIGRDPLDIGGANAVWNHRLLAIGAGGLVNRARSLLDVCLWDLAGQHAEQPLWSLLAESPVRTDSDVLLVDYAAPGETRQELASRLLQRVDDGFQLIKTTHPSDDLQGDHVAGLISHLGGSADLVIEMAWCLSTVSEGVGLLRRWGSEGIGWVEDPMSSIPPVPIAELRARSGVALGAGDEVARVDDLARLVDADAVDVLRIDPMTVGGITGFIDAMRMAEKAGVQVSPHIYPHLASHFATAWQSVRWVESFPSDGFDFIATGQFISPIDYGGGRVARPEGSGVALPIDWEAVARMSTHHLRVDATT